MQEPLDNIKLKDPYVMKLVKAYDEKMQTLASGVFALSRAVVMVAVEEEKAGGGGMLLLLWRWQLLRAMTRVCIGHTRRRHTAHHRN